MDLNDFNINPPRTSAITTIITNSGLGHLYSSRYAPDTFNAPLTVNNLTGSSTYLANQSSGTAFNDVTTFNATGTGTIYVSYHGQETELNFKPDGRRPIYCQKCLEKVKKGQEVPLQFKPKIIERKAERPEEQAELKELGIEFGGGGRSESFGTQKEEPKAAIEEKKTETPPVVSLKDAVQKDPISFRRKRKEVDLKGLRKTIEEAIDKKEKE